MRMALLSPAGVFLRMEDVQQPTERHLPQITECDLPSGKYQWVADPLNSFGGAFWPIAWLERVKQDKLDVVAATQAAQRLAERRAQRKIDREQEEHVRQQQERGN